MSYWCQFCDKEMNFHDSVVYEKEYITCGADSCKEKARDVAQEITKEKSMKKMDVILFSSKDPTDPASWRAVEVENYPDFIVHGPEIMEQMVKDGTIVNKYHCNASKEIYYCAKLTKDVRKEINAGRL